MCFLLICNFFGDKKNHIFDSNQYLLNESRATMGQDGSVPEFHVNFGSGWITVVVGRVGSGQENWTHVQLWAESQ